MRYTNAQGSWRYIISYDRTTKDFAVVVIDEFGTAQTITHVGSYLEGERYFRKWLVNGHNAMKGTGIQQ